MKILIIIFCMILFTPLSQISAFEYYGTIEYFGVDSDPKFCLVNIEEDPNYDQENIAMFERIVKNSLAYWVEKLEEKTGNNWKIDYEFVNFNDPVNPIYEKNCDVFIIFVNDIDGGISTGITSIGEDTEKIIIHILYSHVEFIESEDGDYYYYTPKYSGYISDESYMTQVTKHEIGHALGLDHYITNNSLLLDRWYNGFEKPPSIMIEDTPNVGYENITELDLEKIISIYGTDGFEKSNTIIPDWIKDNANWWSEGLISDDEYVSAIQYMIKNKIIII